MEVTQLSKLEELLQTFCPDGVLSCTFGQVVNYEQPSKYIVKNTDYNDDYETPVLTAGQTFVLGYTNETKGIYNASKESPVIIFDDFTGAFKWVDFPFKVKSSAMKILTADETKVTLRYIYHVMGKIAFTSDEHKRLWIGTYSTFKLPLPSLPVQSEIARILDNFTELTAELTARKKQYEYYQNILLTCDGFNIEPVDKKLGKEIQWLTLGEVCTLKAGKTISSTEIFHEPFGKYQYPCFGGNGLRGYVKSYNQEGNFSLIGRQGALCGNVCYASGKFYATEHAVVVEPKGKCDERFLYYILIAANLNQYKTAGAQPGLSVAKLEKVLVLIPSMSAQKRIVDILDRFDALCNDITIGLPAEIEARQKQYEYYRDKLLSFKEKK